MPPNTCFQEVCSFFYRDILNNKITGTILSQMSALVKLEALYVLTGFIFSVKTKHCSILVLMSVGLACLFLSRSSFFFCQGSWLRPQWRTSLQPTLKFHTCANICSGQIISPVCPQTVHKLLVSVGSCASFSAFQKVCLLSLQERLVQRTDWDNPSADVCAGRATISVGPHSLFNYCWTKLFAF